MSNIKLIVTNQLNSMSLSSVPDAEVNLPVDNLKRSEKSLVMRTTSTSIIVTGVLPGQVTADGVFLSNYSFNLDATLNLTLKLQGVEQLNQNFQTDAQLIPLGTWVAGVDPYGGYTGKQIRKMVGFWFSAPVTYDEIILTINDPANIDGYFDVGRIFIGQAYSPQLNMSYGCQLEWLDDVRHERTYSGSLHSTGGSDHRRMTINLNYLSDSDRAALETELFKNNRKSDLLISGYPGVGGVKEMTHQFIAKREKAPRYSHNFSNNNTLPLVFLEV